MLEKPQPKIGKDDFPDDESPENAGCYMYAFYKLGLDPEEARMGVYPQMLNKYFTRVDSRDEANALGIRHRVNGRYDHLVFIDQSKNGEMKQRGNVGWPIETTSLNVLESHYRPDEYEYVYLKKKVSSDKKPRLLNVLQRMRGKVN